MLHILFVFLRIRSTPGSPPLYSSAASDGDKRRSESNAIIAGFHRDMVYDARELTNSLDSQYAKAKSNYEKYVSDGILTDELISSTVFLAKLDNYFRSSVIDSSFYLNAQEDIDDLKAMVALIDKSKFEAKHHCFLNPTFGKGSTLVGDADADLIIDDTPFS